MDQSISNPPNCAGGCGFFGNPANSNLCSKCSRNKAPEAKSEAVVAAPVPVAAHVQAPYVTPAPSDEPARTPTDSPAKPKNRCGACNKKVGLLGFECRCEGLFCTEHRYADKHACTFDFKAHDREKLAKSNPTVVAEKIRKL